jgi:outer membrane lipoprotein-sorting protein
MGGDMAMTMVSDGKDTFMYMKAMNQYMKMPSGISMSASGNIDDKDTNPFNDQLNFARYAKVEYAGTETVEGVECSIVKGTADGTEYLVYLQPDSRVRRTVLNSGTGSSRSHLTTDYAGYIVDAVFDPSTFTFKPPPGATEMKTPTPQDYDAKLVKVGAHAPSFALPNPKGGTVSLAATRKRSKAVLVNFWFYG